MSGKPIVVPAYYKFVSSRGARPSKLIAPDFFPEALIIKDWQHWANIMVWGSIGTYSITSITEKDYLSDTHSALCNIYHRQYTFKKRRMRLKLRPMVKNEKVL